MYQLVYSVCSVCLQRHSIEVMWNYLVLWLEKMKMSPLLSTVSIIEYCALQVTSDIND